MDKYSTVEKYVMENGRGVQCSILEDWKNDVSTYVDDYRMIKFDSAEGAGNYAFAHGFRE